MGVEDLSAPFEHLDRDQANRLSAYWQAGSVLRAAFAQFPERGTAVRSRQRGNVFKRPGRTLWYIDYHDHTGKRRTECILITVKTPVGRILSQRLAEVSLRRTGVIDARHEAVLESGRKTVEEHLAEDIAMLEARSRARSASAGFIREIAARGRWQTVADIGPDCLNRAAANMMADGFAARTVQGRLVACKGFVKWLSDHDKLSRNPLQSVKNPSVETDRRQRRRMLLPAE